MRAPGTTPQATPAAVGSAARGAPAPLLAPAVGLMAGIWLSDALGAVAGGARLVLHGLPLALAAGLVACTQRAASGRLGTGLAVALALAVGAARHQLSLQRPEHHVAHLLGREPELTRVSGRIVTAPVVRPPLRLNPFLPRDPPARTQFVLALDALHTATPPAPLAGNARVSIVGAGLGLRLGQRVLLTGTLYRPAGPRNPGALDWGRWYRRQGLDAGLSVAGAAHVRVLPDRPGWWARSVTALRAAAQGCLFEPFADLETGEPAQLLEVMVLGQRSAADRALNEAFLRAGGMHFLSVSGYHVGVLAGAAWWLARRALGCGRRIAGLAMLGASLLYALIAEPNAPILRATIMVVLAAAALLAGRPLGTLNWLACAAAAILLVSPHELFRAGFQLSFVLMLALLTIVPAAGRWRWRPGAADGPPAEARTWGELVRMKAGRWAGALAAVSVVAYAVALPLTLLHFGRLAPWGWLGTLLITPLVGLTIVLSFLVLLAAALLPPLADPAGVALRAATALLLRAVGAFEHLPAALVDCRSPPAWLVAATYAGLVLFVVRSRRGRAGHAPPAPARSGARAASRALAPAGGAVLLGLAWLGWLVLPPAARGPGHALYVLAVGNASSAVLVGPSGKAAVLDVGTDTNTDAGATVADALRALGARRVDAAVISHANFDHYSGLPTLLRRRPVGCWLTNRVLAGRDPGRPPLGRLLALLPPGTGPPTGLEAGDRLAVDGAELEVLWPPAAVDDTWPVNDTSLVLRVRASGQSVLLTGDVERAALRALLEAERSGALSLRADVLIAPHHGAVLADVTAELLAAVAPRVVVVSTRTPRPRLAGLVEEVLGPAARVLETGAVGAVVVRLPPAGGPHVAAPWAPPER